jgi:uncharacterized BrkB/YihY/UPF0761 family membrane protein
MNKRILLVGVLLLAIGIVFALEANSMIAFSNFVYDESQQTINEYLIIGYILMFVGVVLLIYGVITERTVRSPKQ